MSPDPRPDLLDNTRWKSQGVHPMLVGIPLGLFATSVVFDLIDLATRTGAFNVPSYWLIAAGVVGGLLAAPFGYLDWRQVPRGSRARRVGAVHGAGNAVVLLLFACSWLLRAPEARVPGEALLLSLAGAAFALFTAWLGGGLLARLGRREKGGDRAAGAH
jgi:uncharacterized membrane protein